MRRLLIFVLLPLILVLAWYFLQNKAVEYAVPQDGTVSLDFKGQHYAVSGNELLIWASVTADRDRITEIPTGQKWDFHFMIGATPKRNNDALAKGQDWIGKNLEEFHISWDESQIPDPESLVPHKVTVNDSNLLHMSLQSPRCGYVPATAIPGDQWLQIDQISQGRARGHFGGTFGDPTEPVEIANGTFDVPIEKLYRYK